MKKATQRVLSLLLAAVLLFGMLPMSAFAAETEQTGIAAPEADVTDPPEAAESEPVESVGDDTIPTEETQVETDPMETTAPTIEPEVTHGEDTQPVETVPETTHGEEGTEPAETVPETVPVTEPAETVPETVPATEPEETQPEVTEPAVTETGDPQPEITVDTPIIDHDDLILNGAGSEITPYAANDTVCRVLGRIYTNVQEYDPVNHIENGIIRYEFPAGTPKARSFVELHTLKLNGAWKTAYCMEPGEPTVPAGSNYNSKVYTMNELLNSGLISKNLTKQQVEAMGLVSLYGQQTFPDSYKTTAGKAAIGRMTATQILIWEIAIGWRSSSKPYSLLNDSFMRRFKDKNQGIGCIMNYSQYWSMGNDLAYITNIRTAYNEIAAKVEKHYRIPSFTQKDIGKAPIIYLEPDGKGNYTATVTDTNNILSEYTLPTMDGVTFTKNGNKLTITTKNKFDAKLVAPTKTVPNFEDQTYYYWYSGSYQTLISCAAEPSYDPVPAYFKIQSKEREGKIEVNKNDPNGKKLDGAYFVATNQETGEKYTIGPTVNGYASKDHIPYGSYEIEETVFPKGYTTSGTSKWTKTLNESTPNETITINAVNKLITGTGKVIKKSTNGGTVEGWWFYVWEVTDGGWVWNCRKQTDSSGVITLNLAPGRYVVREVKLSVYGTEGLTVPSGVDPQYWVCDYTDKYITIVAGETTEVAFVNRQIGKVEIVKALTDPSLGTVEGWRFSIANEAGKELGIYTTDATGTIVTDLEPGTYIVTELLDADSMWECITPNPQTVIVEAGKTATVSFVNAPRTGEIRIYKVDTNNQPLDGVEFLLEWSENGTDWQPVYSCEPGNPQIGGCTSESLKEGRLVSGADGIVVFDGLHPALQYRLTETATKNGYQLLAGYAYQGKLPIDRDLTVSIRVVNTEKFTLPNTGSQSLVLMPMSVLLCLGLCAGAILFLRRKED